MFSFLGARGQICLIPTYLPLNKIHYSYPNSGESIGINLDKNVFLTFPVSSMDKMEYRLLNQTRKDSLEDELFPLISSQSVI